ncbi:21974_t:CDS:2, partial [Entrophospora sp. SA101]
IGDLWCGPGQFTKDKNDDNDCHYVFDYNDKELLDTKTKEDHNMKKAKEILKMQSYGAIGTNSDCLDNLVIPQNHLIIMLTYHTQAFLIVVRILEYGKGLVSGMQSLDETNCKIIMELFEELIKMTAFNVGNQSSVKLFETGLSLFVKLCKCGEDLIIPSMIEKCLNTFVPLLRENYVSLTLKTYILQQIIICMIEPQVVEKLLGWNDPNDLKNNTHALYQKHILSFLLI